MPFFKYTARDQAGVPVSGTLEAASRSEALQRLARQNHFVVTLEESRRNPMDLNLFTWGRVNANDLILFNRQLATMVNAGMPFAGCLRILANQARKQSWQEVLGRIRDDVEGGLSFSEALGRHPRVFPSFFVSAVRAGEAGGILDKVLSQLATLTERNVELRLKFINATFYPLLLMGLAFLVVIFLVIKVIPQFREVFLDNGVPLPLPTQMLMAGYDALLRYWYLFLAGLGGAAAGIAALLRSDRGRLAFDQLRLAFPLAGDLYLKYIIARFSLTLSMLLSSGVTILNALEAIEGMFNNRVMSGLMRRMRETIQEGGAVATPLRNSPVIPAMVSQMVSAGEESGTIPQMLEKVAVYYDLEFEFGLRRFVTLMEPLMLMLVGGAVFFVVLSVILPMFKLIDTIS